MGPIGLMRQMGLMRSSNMDSDKKFLAQRGRYKELIVYKKAQCIYDITYYFIHNYIDAGDRTADQMLQAARSGKQNIVEGLSASTTSRETEIRLINVAKSSFKELLEDYEDYLRVRGLELWPVGSEKAEQTRKICKEQSSSAYYIEAIKVRSAETIANIALVLLHQEDYLLKRVFEKLKRDFKENGGIKEELYQVRKELRKK